MCGTTSRDIRIAGIQRLIEGFLPDSVRRVDDASALRSSDVIHEDVDGAELLKRALTTFSAPPAVERSAVTASTASEDGHFPELGGRLPPAMPRPLAQMQTRQPSAAKGLRARKTQPLARAGDDSGLTVELEIHIWGQTLFLRFS
jgi:hypothetical protein